MKALTQFAPLFLIVSLLSVSYVERERSVRLSNRVEHLVGQLATAQTEGRHVLEKCAGLQSQLVAVQSSIAYIAGKETSVVITNQLPTPAPVVAEDHPLLPPIQSLEEWITPANEP